MKYSQFPQSVQFSLKVKMEQIRLTESNLYFSIYNKKR